MSSLKKFGDAVCQHASENFTVVSTEGIFLEKAKPASAIAEPEKVADLALLGNGLLNVCGTCRKKGDYWTLKCPSKESVSTKVFSFGGEKPTTGDDVSAGASVKGSYVPPSMRLSKANDGENMKRPGSHKHFRRHPRAGSSGVVPTIWCNLSYLCCIRS